MRIRLLGAGQGESLQGYLTSFLVDDRLAVDAGSVGFVGNPESQGAIDDILVTHSHADHLASLPVLLENTWGLRSAPIRVHGTADVLTCLREDVFNDRLWPDLIARAPEGAPFLELCEIRDGASFAIGDKTVTAVAVDHTVPSVGYLIDDGKSSVLFVGDTGPTSKIWEVANAEPRLKAVFLESSFPNEELKLATLTKHLTPSMFAVEKSKVTTDVPFVAFHIKSRYRDSVVEQLRGLDDEKILIGDANLEYRF